jgi:hypothetical protein
MVVAGAAVLGTACGPPQSACRSCPSVGTGTPDADMQAGADRPPTRPVDSSAPAAVDAPMMQQPPPAGMDGPPASPPDMALPRDMAMAPAPDTRPPDTAMAGACVKHSDCAASKWCNAGACADLMRGLVGYWKLDETAGPSKDASGNNLNGAWQGMTGGDTMKPTVRFADTGSLKCLRANMDRVRVTRTPMLETTTVTVSLWVRRNGNVGNTGWATLVRKAWMNNMTPTYGSYGIQLPANDWTTAIFSTGHAGAVDDLRTGVGAVPDTTWVHLAGVYDPAGAAPQKRLYINGAMTGSKTLTTPMAIDTTATGDLYMCDAGSGTNYFSGNIDDVRIYNRALADGEIAALAAGQ